MTENCWKLKGNNSKTYVKGNVRKEKDRENRSKTWRKNESKANEREGRRLSTADNKVRLRMAGKTTKWQ